jgi:hypothetical protein
VFRERNVCVWVFGDDMLWVWEVWKGWVLGGMKGVWEGRSVQGGIMAMLRCQSENVDNTECY